MTNIRKQTAKKNRQHHPTQSGHLGNEAPPLAEVLIQLDDDFTEYSEISAFLCHSFATALSDHESLNKSIASGAQRCSNWLQFRSEELKDDIRHAHALYAAEQKRGPRS